MSTAITATERPASRTFAIRAATRVDFPAPGDQSLASATLSLNASASSGLPVAYASLTTQVCTVSGTTVSLIAAGTCTVSASQDGNASYAAAPTVARSFVIAGSGINALVAAALLAIKGKKVLVLEPQGRRRCEDQYKRNSGTGRR